LVFLSAAHPIANTDFGWHVALGRWVLEHGAVARVEPFTHTALGAPMVAHSWLSQVLYAAVIDGFGIVELRLANAGIAAALVALLYGWLRRAGVDAALALFGAALWAVIAESRLQLRPHTFNMFFFMLAYGMVFVSRPRLGPLQLSGVFLATAVWTNLHSGAVLFPVLAGLYAAAVTVEQRILRRPARADDIGEGRLPRLWALAALALLAVFVTPSHVLLLPYALESASVNASLSLEWLPLLSERAIALRSPVWLAAYGALMLGVVVTAWLGRRRIALADLVVVLFLAALPLQSQRFTWTTFVPVIFVCANVSRILVAEPEAHRRTSGARFAFAGLAVAFAATLASPSGFADLARRLTPAGNFRPAFFPVGAMRFLEQVKLEGNLFNGNKWGGYVLFRTGERYPVFVDGRWITIGERVVRHAHAISHRTPGYETLLERYEIEILLVHRGWMNEEVRREGVWLPVFENFNGGVYLRNGPHFERNAARCAGYYAARGIPFEPDTGFAERTAFEENPGWARRHQVKRRHLDQFGHHGARSLTEKPRWVSGW
jgi:hypothetical protein